MHCVAYNVCHAPQILSEMLPVFHAMDKGDFLKSITHSQII